LPERREGTLLSHFRQRAHGDPLLYPGLQDITAWVDYTLLAEGSRAAGFTLSGFTTQSFFLAGLRVDHEMQIMADGDDARFARLANQARQLMLPGEMGERFKAMAWLRAWICPWPALPCRTCATRCDYQRAGGRRVWIRCGRNIASLDHTADLTCSVIGPQT